MQRTLTPNVILPGAPPIAGLTFRQFRGPSDYPLIAAISAAAREADGVEFVDTVDDVAVAYAHLTNCDPYRDLLFAEVDGQAIGYQRVFWRQEAEGDRVYGHFGYLRPAWRRRGIGRAMLHHAEHRLRALAREHGPLPRQLLQTEVAESEVGANALLRSEGYALVRYAFIMVRPLQEPIPETDLPAGLEVRPVRADQYQAVWEAADEAFRDHWGYHPQTEADYSIWRENRRFQPDLWQVAWQGDQVAGMVLNFIDAEENQRFSRRRGYTENICVRRPWRRRGLARALILRSLALLHDRGLQEASLGVDAENRSGALSLYEGVGFRPVQVFNFYRKPIDFGQTPTATGIPAA